MKKMLTLALAMALTAGLATAQIVDIDDIQVYTVAGQPASPYDGQQVTVSGKIYVVAGTYNGGTHYIQDATGGLTFYSPSPNPLLTIGDTVEITGTIGSFGTEIQFGNGATWTFPVEGDEPAPVETTPSGILGDVEPYEWVGNFAAVTGTIADIDGSTFYMVNTGGGVDTLECYVDSDTGIDLSGMEVGDEYKVLGPLVNFNTLIELKPRMQADLIADPTLPIIREVDLDDWVPSANDPIEVQIVVSDDQGIADATITYRSNNTDGTEPGAWMTSSMSMVRNEDWVGSIPGQTSDKVDFYVTVEDMEGQVVSSPGNAPDGYLECAIGLTSIYEMQWVHPDSSDQTNPYDGKVLNIRGVVTAGTGDTAVPSQMIVQEQETGPYGGYRYGAVVSRLGSGYATSYYRGDLVDIGGTGDNYFGLDQIAPHNANAVNVLAFGVALPPAERATTQVLADDSNEDGTPRRGEAYENVWVKTYVAEILGVGTFSPAEYWISDTGAWADSLEVQPNQELTYVPMVADVLQAEGYLDYSYSDYVVRPIGDEYIYFTATGVEDIPTVEAAGGFVSVYPNPFNPATKIEFVLNRDNLTQLNIYNIKGELVRSLVNESLPTGTYAMTWDGRNAEGMGVASGQYFARLRIGAEVMQVRKLSLIK